MRLRIRYNTLPDEIHLLILPHLGAKDLITMRAVCLKQSRLARIIQEERCDKWMKRSRFTGYVAIMALHDYYWFSRRNILSFPTIQIQYIYQKYGPLSDIELNRLFVPWLYQLYQRSKDVTEYWQNNRCGKRNA